MVTARTTERDRQVRLALGLIRRHQQREQIAKSRQELVGNRLLQKEPANRCIAPGEGPKLVDPVRVRQEATVEDEVDVDRQAVLVAKAEDAHLHRAAAALIAEGVDDAIVDDHVGFGLDDFERLSFRVDRPRKTVFGRPRVRSPAALVARDERRRSSLQEDNTNSA